ERRKEYVMSQRKPDQCPCCGCYTLDGRGQYDICPVCFWEDDDATEEYGKPAPERPEGPNHIHLWQARQNYLDFGASEKRLIQYVRLPSAAELPDARRAEER